MLARLLRVQEPSVFDTAPWEELPDEALPTPPLLHHIPGRLSFPLSTRGPEARDFFEQGLRLLHLGWAPQARRSFAEAARRDADFALAHWGLALTRGAGHRHAADRAASLARALTLSQGASDAEQRYIIAAQHLGDKGPANGRHGFVREMEALIDRYPQDAEARLLLAGFLAEGYEPEGRPCTGQPYAQALLRELLVSHPRHDGVHCAWVRAMEGSSRPEVALESARALKRLAPDLGAALLASGNLLRRLGHMQEAKELLVAAVAADEGWLERESLSVSAAPAVLLALRQLVRVCADMGRYGEAQSWARQLRTRVATVEPRRGQAQLFAAATLCGLHLRFGFWKAAADVRMELGSEASPTEQVLLEGMKLYTRGLAALEAGRLGEAEHACAALEALHAPLQEARRADAGTLCPRDVARSLEVAAVELRGSLDARHGELTRAEATLVRAVRMERRLRPQGSIPFWRPARETLVRARLRGGRLDKVEEPVEELLTEHPGSGHVWLAVAEVHLAHGDMERAAEAFTAVVERWREADVHLPELRRARAFLEAHRPLSPVLQAPGVGEPSARVSRGVLC